MYLLDTNVVSELRKVGAGRAAPGVTRWQANVAGEACFLSVITLLEIELGVLRLERRDARQGRALRVWLEENVRPTFAGRVLAVDAAVATRCARLHVPDPRPERDALIAATALEHQLTLVTRNVADFIGAGVAIINPWSEGQTDAPATGDEQ